MKLTFGDVSRLEDALRSEARGAEVNDDDLLTWAAWYEQARHDGLDVGTRETCARLCEVLKTSTVSVERELAVGALMVARQVSTTRGAKARFVLDFALRRILEIRGETRLWSAVQLPSHIQEEARRLFELAKHRPAKPDDELRAAAHEFMTVHGGDADLFGRLATNLQLLLDSLDDRALDEGKKRVARAALSYFALDSDAIPDALGLVGLLDDALIAHEAVCEVRPERAGLLAVLDDVVHSWPFVGELVIEHGQDAHRLSEFMLVNASLLLDKVTSSGQKSVLVVPHPGPLAFILGFVRALGEAHACAGHDFKKGERITNRETSADFDFEGYGRLAGSSFVECGRADATHFKITKRDTKRSAQTPRLEFLASFRPATRSRRTTLKPGVAVFDRDSVELGPLEQLFGSDKPVTIGPQRGRVVIVAESKEARRLADDLSLRGTTLREVLPMGHARLTVTGIEEVAWTAKGPGGDQMVTVVRSAADARHLVDDASKRVVGVVGAVKQGTADASNLAQLATAETQVIALVSALDADSHDTLAEAGFKFWTWDDSWFGALHWPHATRTSRHTVARYENVLRSAGRSIISIERCELPGLDAAYNAARALERLGARDDDESLRTAAADAIAAILTVCRALAPVDASTAEQLASTLDRLSTDIESNRLYWSDEKLDLGREALRGLRSAEAAIKTKNPKFDVVKRWAQSARSPHIACTARGRESLAKQPGFDDLRDVSAFDPFDEGDLLVPCWLGRERMLRVLSMTAFSTTTLVLYPPELDWYLATKRRNDATAQRLQALSSKHVPFRNVTRAEPRFSIHADTADVMTPDDLVSRSLSARVRQSWAGSEDETVEARLVHFTGGTWAAFTKWHAVHRIEAGETHDDSQLVEVRASELRPGDMIVMLKGSDRDALRAEVDRRVPPGTRDAASEWQRALGRYRDKGRSINELRTALAAAGCSRCTSTIREWIDDLRIIQPMRGAEEIEMILKATKDELLRVRLDECKQAAQTLRRQHVLVARDMAAQVLKKATRYLDSGTAPSALVQVDERLVLAAVEAVDPRTLDVPVSYVNRLQETSWQG